MKTNYQLLCDEQIKTFTADGEVPSLLLQSCCGPCSTYVLEYLSQFFEVTVLFYNPNIYPQNEYEKRLDAQKTVISSLETKYPVKLICEQYDHLDFLTASEGLESECEGGLRCVECFKLRLRKTAEVARALKFDCFTTTLTVSPHKNAEILNAIGGDISKEVGVPYLFSDFKKREGYKRSIELSRELEIYRQEYCGCEFSIQ